MATENSPISFFLLRGLAREVRHWGDFCSQLEMAHHHFRVIPLEIPGAGIRRAERSPISIRGYIKEMRQQYLDTLRPNQTTIILGLSFGGMIAARWIHDYPSDFHGAILINTSGRPSPFYERMRFSAATRLLSAVFQRNPILREKRIANVICNLADTEVLAQKWGQIAKSAPMTRSNMLRQLYTAARFRTPPSPTLPTLLLCSANDRLVSAACSHAIADSWNITPIIHQTAGHDLPTDDPRWCIRQIISWLPHLHP